LPFSTGVAACDAYLTSNCAPESCACYANTTADDAGNPAGGCLAIALCVSQCVADAGTGAIQTCTAQCNTTFGDGGMSAEANALIACAAGGGAACQ
jgi:hypothetical protein